MPAGIFRSLAMFVVYVSYLSMLRVISERCQLPYVQTIREVAPDGSTVYGVEVQLPSLFRRDAPRCLFFWSSALATLVTPYEHAALQAVMCLQSIYGFTVVDYNYQNMVSQRELLDHVFSVANRGALLARVIVATSHRDSPIDPRLLQCAELVL